MPRRPKHELPLPIIAALMDVSEPTAKRYMTLMEQAFGDQKIELVDIGELIHRYREVQERNRLVDLTRRKLPFQRLQVNFDKIRSRGSGVAKAIDI